MEEFVKFFYLNCSTEAFNSRKSCSRENFSIFTAAEQQLVATRSCSMRSKRAWQKWCYASHGPVKDPKILDRIPILTPWRLIRHEYVKKQLLDSCRKCYHRTFCAKIAEILLKAHANPNFLTNRGNSVLDALFRKRHFIPPSWDGLETLKLLIQHGLGFSSDKFIKNGVISHAYFFKILLY